MPDCVRAPAPGCYVPTAIDREAARVCEEISRAIYVIPAECSSTNILNFVAVSSAQHQWDRKR